MKERKEETAKEDLDKIEKGNNVSESDTLESDTENKPAPPLGALLDKSTEVIRNVIFTEMAQTGIPASLMDYMLTSVLAEVRDLKAKEYSSCIISKEE